MTNKEIGEQVVWLLYATNRLAGKDGASRASVSFNNIRAAMKARMAGPDPVSGWQNTDWKDAIEMELAFARAILQPIARQHNIDIGI